MPVLFLFMYRQRAVCGCLHTHTAIVREREKLAWRISHRLIFHFLILSLKALLHLQSQLHWDASAKWMPEHLESQVRKSHHEESVPFLLHLPKAKSFLPS